MTQDATPIVRGDLDAYYYGFEATGCAPIDLVLGAVAQAGKAYHATQDWDERMANTTLTPAGNIQLAARIAAETVRRESETPEETRVMLRSMLFWLERDGITRDRAARYRARIERLLGGRTTQEDAT